MKKSKILASVTSAVLLTSMLVIPTHALSWRDGVQKNWSFTYAGGAGVASVSVSDTNHTVNTTMAAGDTVVTKTGYEITGVLENGRAGNFTLTDDGIQFSFTRKGAEIAGISGKDVTFSIQTQAKEYELVYNEPTLGVIELGSCRTGEYIWQTAWKADATFVGWAFNGEKVDVVTEEMAAFGDAHNGAIYVTPIFK